jgi:aspartate carbamoyltransferase catalytic subunit
VTAEVADCPQSLILDQVANGLAVRMGVLWLTCGPRTADAAPTAVNPVRGGF